MNMMLEQFKTIFDRPEKVKKLREVILDLAVKGKLIEQNPSDEPASVLLERIREEKERLIKEGKIKREKPLGEIGEEEKPYELPEGWEWARLGEYSIINPRNSADDDLLTSFIPMKLINDGFNNSHGNEKKQWKEIKSGFTHFAENDIVVAKITPCFENRKSAIMKNLTNGIGAGTTELYVIRSISGMILQEFILLICKTEKFITGGVETYTGTAGQQRVKKDYLSNLVLGLPPLEEQKRIVEKVNLLMIFCDKLEKSLEKKVKYGLLSAKSVFNSIGNVSSMEDIEESLRFIIANFKDLTLSDNAVKELKNAIIQLAVQGKLVTQNQEDEPASVLLESIQEEKERLIKEKKIKKEMSLHEIIEEEKPYALPKGWEWVRFGEITTIKGGKRVPAGYQLLNTPTEHIYIRVADMQDGTIKDNDLKYISNDIYEKIKDYIIESDDLYITIVGSTIGKAGYIPEKFHRMNLTENAARIIVHCVEKNYLLYLINSAYVQQQLIDKTNQVGQPKLALIRLKTTLIQLPPLAEQKRIVEKVDLLMELCDELEKKIEKSKKYSEKLMEAIIKEEFKA